MSDQNKKDNSKFTIDDNVDSMLNIIKKRNAAEEHPVNTAGHKPASDAKKDVSDVSSSASSSLVPPHVQKADEADLQAQGSNDVPINTQPEHEEKAEKKIDGEKETNTRQKAVLKTGHGTADIKDRHEKTRHHKDQQPKNTVVDFDDIDPENARIRRGKRMKKSIKSGRSAAWGLLKTLLYVAGVAAVSIFLAVTIIGAANDIYAFEKPDISVVIEIPEGADTREVAEILKENGVISHPFVFCLYAERKFNGSSYYNGEFKAGEHTIVFKNEDNDGGTVTAGGDFTTDYIKLTKNEDDSTRPLNYDRILSIIAVSTYKERDTVRITVPEGYTVDEIIDLLVSNGVGEKENYIDVIQNHDYDYEFVKLIPENEDRKYRLEGYLFPDTYDFFTDESEISVINKFLANFEIKFEDLYYERAEELGMSVDDLIILASILEKEAKNAEDLPIMSSVFHNRIKSGMMLGSDATVMYLLPERKTALTSEDLAIDSPYNTRKYNGIPPGAISNPGIEAINAAFYPSTTNYYYFLTLTTGETIYSRTEAEHNAAREKARAEGTLAS